MRSWNVTYKYGITCWLIIYIFVAKQILLIYSRIFGANQSHHGVPPQKRLNINLSEPPLIKCRSLQVESLFISEQTALDFIHIPFLLCDISSSTDSAGSTTDVTEHLLRATININYMNSEYWCTLFQQLHLLKKIV